MISKIYKTVGHYRHAILWKWIIQRVINSAFDKFYSSKISNSTNDRLSFILPEVNLIDQFIVTSWIVNM